MEQMAMSLIKVSYIRRTCHFDEEHYDKITQHMSYPMFLCLYILVPAFWNLTVDMPWYIALAASLNVEASKWKEVN